MEKTSNKIIKFIRSFFQKANHHKAVLGLSGGLDSSLTCLLCSRALSPKNVFPLYLPYLPNFTLSEAAPDAAEPKGPSRPSLPSSIQKLFSLTRIPSKNLIIENITPQINAFKKNHPRISKINCEASDFAIGGSKGDSPWPRSTRGVSGSSRQHRRGDRQGAQPLGTSEHNERVDLGNKMARERMSLLYYYARQLKGLVVGTSNLSEILLGYFTLHGDAAWDLAPLAHLYKTQVKKLAQYLKIPPEVINQTPSAGLWPNQTDESELGFSYAQADPILKKYFPNFPNFTLSLPKGPDPLVQKVLKRVSSNSFKIKNFPYSKTLLKP